jgi:hypothetical protein
MNETGSGLLAERLARRILKGQRGLASALNDRTAHYTRQQKKVCLLVFALIMGGLNLYVILSAIL